MLRSNQQILTLTTNTEMQVKMVLLILAFGQSRIAYNYSLYFLFSFFFFFLFLLEKLQPVANTFEFKCHQFEVCSNQWLRYSPYHSARRIRFLPSICHAIDDDKVPFPFSMANRIKDICPSFSRVLKSMSVRRLFSLWLDKLSCFIQFALTPQSFSASVAPALSMPVV